MSRAVPSTLAVVAFAVVLAAASGGVAAQSGQPVQCSFPVSATDASGVEVVIEDEPQRVVVLQPSAAQTMWEIGAEQKVVGMPVNQYTAYLNGSTERTDVAGEQSTVLQSRVVDLEPDLVLAPNVTSPETVESLREAGVTVFHFEEAESLEDIYEKTELTGRLVGAFGGAADRTAETRATVDAIESAVEGRESPTVYYALGGGYTAGSETFIHELITAAGGKNVAAGEFSGYQVLSQEVLAQTDPDWIVTPGDIQPPRNDAINGTTAVQADQILPVDDNYMNQAGPRSVTPLRRMAAAFHPDADVAGAVENVEPPAPSQCASAVETPDPTVTPTQSETATTGTPGATAPDTPTTTPGSSGPGFGVGTVGLLLVLGCAGVLVARRHGE